LTVPGAIIQAGQDHQDRPAVIYGDSQLTYGDLTRAIGRVAGSLAELGIQPGDRVALIGPNSHLYVVAYLAIMHAGASVVPVNPMLKPDEVRYMFVDAEVKAAIAFGPLANLVAAASQGLDDPPQLITVGESDVPGVAAFDRWPLEGPEDFDPPQIPQDQVAAILYTAGTTGRPKGAMLSHHNLVWDAEACRQAIEFTTDDRVLAVLPMFHSYAATVGVVLPLTCGACCVAMDRFSPAEVAATVQRDKCTVLPCVPAMCGALLRAADELPPGAFESLRMVASGGAPMPVALMKAFEERLGLIVLEGDGPTECSPVCSVNPPQGVRKPGTVGPPIPGVEMKIVDDDDTELPPGEVGEICVRGPNVMLGYLNQPEATAEAMKGGWFHTGDLGHVDEDGYFSIVDRKKDMVIVGGLNVYPREVEEVLLAHPHVREAAVIGVYDDIRGEKLKAFVIPEEGVAPERADILRLCREKLANFKVPKEIAFVDDLPRSLKGTVLKRELRDSHSGSAPSGGQSS
jgi:long-chain acyl-CoA synthetase